MLVETVNLLASLASWLTSPAPRPVLRAFSKVFSAFSFSSTLASYFSPPISMEKALMKAESGMTRAKLATWATASGLLTVLSTTVLAYRNWNSDLMWNLVVSRGSVATSFSVVVVVDSVVVLVVVVVVVVVVEMGDMVDEALTSMHP